MRYVESIDTLDNCEYIYESEGAGITTLTVRNTQKNNILVQQTIFKGREYEKIIYDSWGHKTITEILRGNTRTTLRSKGDIKEVETLNDRHQPIKLEYGVSGNNAGATLTVTYRYNEKNDCASETYLSSHNNNQEQSSSAHIRFVREGTGTYTYNYVYDSQGNWTERKCWNGNQLRDWTIREIKYANSSEEFIQVKNDDKYSEAYLKNEISKYVKQKESDEREKNELLKKQQEERVKEENIIKKQQEEAIESTYYTAIADRCTTLHPTLGGQLGNVNGEIKKCTVEARNITFEVKKNFLSYQNLSAIPVCFTSLNINGKAFKFDDNNAILLSFNRRGGKFVFLVLKDRNEVYNISGKALEAIRNAIGL